LRNIAIIVCVVASVIGVWMLLHSSYDVLFRPKEAVPGVRLVFPSVSGLRLPEFIIGVPFWYWIIGVFVVLFAHEPMHAFLARAENVRIKSFGLLLFFILPGAFVDPDEKQIKRLSMMRKLRIFAAGSFGNLMVAGILLVLILSYNFLIDSLMTAEGVVFEKTIEDTGAHEVGVRGTIIGVDDKDVKSIVDFTNAMKDVKVGDVVSVKTT